jgi:hypothetical protein
MPRSPASPSPPLEHTPSSSHDPPSLPLVDPHPDDSSPPLSLSLSLSPSSSSSSSSSTGDGTHGAPAWPTLSSTTLVIDVGAVPPSTVGAVSPSTVLIDVGAVPPSTKGVAPGDADARAAGDRAGGARSTPSALGDTSAAATPTTASITRGAGRTGDWPGGGDPAVEGWAAPGSMVMEDTEEEVCRWAVEGRARRLGTRGDTTSAAPGRGRGADGVPPPPSMPAWEDTLRVREAAVRGPAEGGGTEAGCAVAAAATAAAAAPAA